MEYQNMYQSINYLQQQGVVSRHVARPAARTESNPHETLHATRVQLRMSLDELSRLSRLPVGKLRKYESGEEVPDICAMKVLERLFGKQIA